MECNRQISFKVNKFKNHWKYYDLSTLRYTCIYMDSSHHSGIKRDIILLLFLMHHKSLHVKIFICLDLSHHTETNSNLILSEKAQQPTGNSTILALWDAHFLIIICLDLSYPTEIILTMTKVEKLNYQLDML